MIVRKNLSVKKIIRFTWKKVLIIGSVAAIVTLCYRDFGFSHFSVSTAPASILGTALAILLGFRNNSAYDRWWEARRLWGAVVNDCRTLSRQINSFLSPTEKSDKNPEELAL